MRIFWCLPVLFSASTAFALPGATKAVKGYLAQGTAKVTERGSFGTMREFDVTREWKDGKGVSTAGVRMRTKNGRTKTVTDWNTVATTESLKVKTTYPKGSFLAGMLKSDEMRIEPTKGGFKALDIRTVQDGSEHSMLRVVVNKNRIEYTQPEFSSHAYEAKRGRAFHSHDTLPYHLRGDVKTMSPATKVELATYLRSTGMSRFNTFINERPAKPVAADPVP